jgi:hypothetical protein
MHFFYLERWFSEREKNMKTGTMDRLSSCGVMFSPALPWSVNRDNNVVAGLHPITPLHVSNLYTLSLPLSLDHNVWTSLSVEQFCGERDSLKLRCDEVAPSHGQRMGHDQYSSGRSGFPNLYIYTQPDGGTMTDKYGFQHSIDIYNDKKDNCWSCRCS